MKSIQPWKLRLEHLGFSHIRMDWAKEPIHFNPATPVDDGSIVVVLWNWPEQLEGVRQSVIHGKQCKIIASPEILSWLSQYGPVDGDSTYEQDGLNIELEPYLPIPSLTISEGARKVRSLVRRPTRSIHRLLQKGKMPSAAPQIAWVRFPSGALLAHFNLSLHSKTPTEWLQSIQEKGQKSSWMLVGCDYEMEKGFLECLRFFPDRHILLTDLIGDYRRKNGLPTKLLTPIADKAISQNYNVQVFATKVGYRFDTIDLINP